MFLISSVEDRLASSIDRYGGFLLSSMCAASAAAIVPLAASSFGFLRFVPFSVAMGNSLLGIIFDCVGSTNPKFIGILDNIAFVANYLYLFVCTLLIINSLMVGKFTGLLLLVPIAVWVHICKNFVSDDGEVIADEAAKPIVRVLLPVVLFSICCMYR